MDFDRPGHPDDWKGEHIIRNVPRNRQTTTAAQSRRGGSQTCAGENCVVMIWPENGKYCYDCMTKMRRENEAKRRQGRRW